MNIAGLDVNAERVDQGLLNTAYIVERDKLLDVLAIARNVLLGAARAMASAPSSRASSAISRLSATRTWLAWPSVSSNDLVDEDRMVSRSPVSSAETRSTAPSTTMPWYRRWR